LPSPIKIIPNTTYKIKELYNTAHAINYPLIFRISLLQQTYAEKP